MNTAKIALAAAIQKRLLVLINVVGLFIHTRVLVLSALESNSFGKSRVSESNWMREPTFVA